MSRPQPTFRLTIRAAVSWPERTVARCSVFVAVLLALLAAGDAAGAQETCPNAVTQSDINDCMDLAWRRADDDLNAAYSAAMETMRRSDGFAGDDQGAAQLREAQRAWLPFRDAACASEGFLMRGGSGEPMLVLACLARLTEQRADDLRLFDEMQ